jgi:hypothetical protein
LFGAFSQLVLKFCHANGRSGCHSPARPIL